jgi:flagellar biosynthesis protein FlhA
LDTAWEEHIRAGFEQGEQALMNRMSPSDVESVCRLISEQIESLTATGRWPIVLVNPQIRAAVKRLTENYLPELVVLSYHEVTRDTRVVMLGSVADNVRSRDTQTSTSRN